MSRLLKSAAALALVLACTCAGSAAAQDWKGRGRAQGIVKDEQGKPVAGAKVTLRPGKGRVEASSSGPPPLTTDKNGKWATLGLAGGPWGVLIEADGFIASEGQIQIQEEGPPAPPITIALKRPTAEQQQQTQAAKEPTKGAQAKEALIKGNDLLAQQKYSEARTEYQKALDLLETPDIKPSILRTIASTYFKESGEAKTKQEKAAKLDQAITILKQALDIKPDDPETLQLLVDLLVDAGKETEAQTYMAKLPAGTKVAPDTMINIGIRYFNDKQYDKALAQFNKVAEQNPDLPDTYYYRGLVYLNMNKIPDAKADFKKLLALDPNHKYAKEAKDYLNAL
ncbi:MAG TPA: tetratricopeptide repeat protein, partial [Dongiaceae bacterium]